MAAQWSPGFDSPGRALLRDGVAHVSLLDRLSLQFQFLLHVQAVEAAWASHRSESPARAVRGNSSVSAVSPLDTDGYVLTTRTLLTLSPVHEQCRADVVRVDHVGRRGARRVEHGAAAHVLVAVDELVAIRVVIGRGEDQHQQSGRECA